MAHPEEPDTGPSEEGFGHNADLRAHLNRSLDDEPNTPSLAEQQRELQEMQAAQAQVLRASGIFDIALRAFQYEDERLVRAFVARNQRNDGLSTTLAIRLDITTTNDQGNERHINASVPVAEQLEGLVMPMPGFSDEQATVISKLAEGLDAAKSHRILPALSYDLTEIGVS